MDVSTGGQGKKLLCPELRNLDIKDILVREFKIGICTFNSLLNNYQVFFIYLLA